jgi:two-component system, OmpR family, response regulator
MTHSKSEPTRALIVDDEMDICFLLSSILKNKVFSTSYVNNLADAKKALNREYPNILFLDNYLPDGLGLDFIPYVKQNFPLTKIIVITAHDTADERKKAVSEGADFFVVKPFNTEQIGTIVQKTLTSLM